VTLWILLTGSIARADVDFPDIKADAERYRAHIVRQIDPADDIGAHLQVYKDAVRARRWRAAITELEALLRHAPDDAETWLRLSRAWRSVDPQSNEVTAAAYNAYLIAIRTRGVAGADASEALMILARQFESQGRRQLAVRAWAEVGRLISDPALQTELAEKNASDGDFGVGGSPTVVSDTRAPKVCVDFTAPLDESNADAYHDWIRVSHLVGRDHEEAMSFDVTVKDRTLCIFGLKHGERYRLRLSEGVPARDGRKLKAAWSEDTELPSRHSDIAFRSDTLVLPVNGSGNVPIRSVGVPTATLLLLHVTDRQIINEIALGHLRSNLSPQDVRALLTRSGRLVWWGTADLNRDRNAEKTSSIPIGDILKARIAWQPGMSGQYAAGFLSDGGSPVLGPGIYGLVALPQRCTDLAADLIATGELPTACRDVDGNNAALATQWIDYTGLGLQFVRGPGGLTVAVRSLEQGTARPGTRVQLVSTANRVLAEAVTDSNGTARFDPGLAKGALGNQLQGVYALSESGDFAFLDAAQDAYDLSDRGVLGRMAPGAVDVYAWTERGIYRPGEVIPAAIMVRDARARPIDPPALTVRLVGPDETALAERSIAASEFKAGVAVARVPLPTDATPGAWRIEVRNGRDTVGAAPVQVESFVPSRIQFEMAGLSTVVLRPGEPVSMRLRAEYLYGGPAVNLSGRYRLSLRRAAHPFSAFESFHFGRQSDQVVAAGPIVPIQRTGEDGTAEVSVVMDPPPKQDCPMEAVLRVQLDDTDGASVGKEFVLPMRRPQQQWIGARLAPVDSASDPTAIEMLAVDSAGARHATHVRWELYAEDDAFQWSRVPDRDQYNYVVSTQRTLLSRGDRAVGTDRIERLVIDQPPGRYDIVLFDDEAGTSTELSFVAGFAGTTRTAGRPDLVRLTLDRPVGEYAPGETVTAHVRSAISGELMLLVASDSVYRVINQTIPADGNLTLRFPADENWGPHPYLLATVFGNGKDSQPGPSRAVGVTSFSITPTHARLDVTLDVPPETVPRRTEPGTRMQARVRIAGAGAGEPVYVLLSAVDAGILSLTDYQVPDPVRYFHGQRRLAVDLLDTYGRLIRDQGSLTPLRSGGDVMGSLRGLDYTWPGVVAWVSDIIPVIDGRATIDVPIPDFLGRLQLVAVAWTGDRAGVANAPVLVRDPVTIRPDLPRFLAPGDQMTIGLDVINFSAGGGEYDLALSADRPLRVTSPAIRHIRLGQGEHARVGFSLATDALDPATRLATSRVRATLKPVAGDALPTVARDWEIPVRSGIEPVVRLVRTKIPARQSLTLSSATLRVLSEDLAPGSVRMQHRIASVSLLARSPSDEELSGRAMSTDQLASRAALQLAAIVELGGWDKVSAELRNHLQATVSDLVSQQRPDGSFRTFPGEMEPRNDQTQRTAFVADVLDQARAAGVPIPIGSLKSAGEFLRRGADASPDCVLTNAYTVFILARLAIANFDTVDGLRRSCLSVAPPISGDTVVARIFAAAAQRAFGFAMDRDVRALFAPPTGVREVSRSQYIDFVYAAAAVSDNPLDLSRIIDGIGDELAAAQHRNGEMPSLGLEQRAKLLLAHLHAVPAAREAEVEVNGQEFRVSKAGWLSDEFPLGSQSTDFVARNASDVPLVDELTIRGAPVQAPKPALDDRLIVDRKLYCFNGGFDAAHPWDPAMALERQQICAVVLEGRGQEQSNGLAVLTEMLPSGWEIETADLRRNPAIAPEAPAQLGLDGANGSAVLRRVAYPDRLVALVDLSRAVHGFRVGFLIRAARAGSFAWPATSATDAADGTRIGGTESRSVSVAE
jgi:uncharacterized protein YfaS (alpha-2-macroglobulin family)